MEMCSTMTTGHLDSRKKRLQCNSQHGHYGWNGHRHSLMGGTKNSGKRLGHMTTYEHGNIKKWSRLQLSQKNPLITKNWSMAKFLIEFALLVLQTKWRSTWILHSLNLCLSWCSTCLLSASPECPQKQHYIFFECTFVLATLFLGLHIATEQLAHCCHFKYFHLEIMGEEQSVIHIIHCLQYSNPAQLLTMICFYNMALRTDQYL
jgi:hypothetical protein